MAQIVERLKSFRAHLNLSQKGLSAKLGISQVSYAKYELGKTEPSCNSFRLLAGMGLNIHWLITGAGDMLLQTQGGERGCAENRPVKYDSNNLETAIKIARFEGRIEELEKQNRRYETIIREAVERSISEKKGQVDCSAVYKK